MIGTLGLVIMVGCMVGTLGTLCIVVMVGGMVGTCTLVMVVKLGSVVGVRDVNSWRCCRRCLCKIVFTAVLIFFL